jgi:hypothetical protein
VNFCGVCGDAGVWLAGKGRVLGWLEAKHLFTTRDVDPNMNLIAKKIRFER